MMKTNNFSKLNIYSFVLFHLFCSSGDQLNVTNACNQGCECTGLSFDPICSHENVRYFTPCHAGCELLVKGEDFTASI